MKELKHQKKIIFIAILLFSILNVFLWQNLGISLNNNLFEIKLGTEISEISINKNELIAYFILSLIVAITYLNPFFLRKKRSLPSHFLTLLIFTLLFFSSSIILDLSAKGIYLVRYMGDDFPFVHRIMLVFIIVPIILYFLTTKLIVKIEKRSIIIFFIIGIISILLTNLENGSLLIKGNDNLKEVISKGYFLFWITGLLGVYSYIISKRLKTK